jgi:glycosyltransferase involved in cell wall biosynthesis
MIVHVYSLCWNEARMIPYYLRHYEPVADRLFVFDDSSSDDSLNLLAASPKTEIGRFDKGTVSMVDSARKFHNDIWKKSRGTADWVVICAIDEHLYHPALPDYLRRCRDAGVTVIPATGWEMVTDRFPAFDGRLCDGIARGTRSAAMDKLCIFNPNAIDEINYKPGRHEAKPKGRLVYPRRAELNLLHFKQLGLDYVVTRSAELRTGLLVEDIRNKWGYHYLWDQETIGKAFSDIREASVEVPRTAAGGDVRPMRHWERRLREKLRKSRKK